MRLENNKIKFAWTVQESDIALTDRWAMERRRNMSLSLAGLANNYYQNYIYQQTKATGQNSGTDFNSVFSAKKTENTGSLQETKDTSTSNVNAYTEYLKSKYGNVTIQSVGKDQASLDRIGKSMSGSDVVIAPNILEKMANDSETAAYYEKKIDDFFDDIPRSTAWFATKGLVYEPGGVVVHEDGSVTYISGCSDSPERVAQVNAENKEKREKEAKQRKEAIERSQEEAEERRQQIESYNQKQAKAEALNKHIVDEENSNMSNLVSFAIASYENATNMYSGSVIAN
jgi:predicted  nucleic acid-binding Zn-ribbon protein